MLLKKFCFAILEYEILATPRITLFYIFFFFFLKGSRKKVGIWKSFLTVTSRRKKPKAMFRGYWRVRNSPQLFKAVQPVIYMQMHGPNCVSFRALHSSFGLRDRVRAGAIKTAPSQHTDTQ